MGKQKAAILPSGMTHHLGGRGNGGSEGGGGGGNQEGRVMDGRDKGVNKLTPLFPRPNH